MYIVERIHTVKSGEKRSGYGLVESRRIDGEPRQKTLLNLGKRFDVPKSDWALLCDGIEDALRGQPSLLPEDPKLRSVIDDIARRLRDQGYDIEAGRDDRTPVMVDEIHHPEVRTVGGERVGLRALEQLGFMELLRTLGLKESHVQLATALVVARMLEPGSEAAAHRWMTGSSAILELLGIDEAPPSASTLYRVGDRLWTHRTAIMDHLFAAARDIIPFEETVIFYDLTNVYFCGDTENELLQYGRSKEQRKNYRLVTLALTLDASGFPRSVEVLPGNVSEPATLKEALSKLGDQRPTVIMDAGIATKANLQWLDQHGYPWLCAERTATPPVPEGDPDHTTVTSNDVRVRAWRLAAPQGEQRVYLHSQARHAVGSRILNRKRARFEAALRDLHAGLSQPRRLKQYDRVLRKVGRLEEQHKQVSYQYRVHVSKAARGTHATAVTFTHLSVHDVRTAALGGYTLRTSHAHWSLDRIVSTYWSLAEIERTFRSLKSELGLRPLYHRLRTRVEAHLFISVLAYHAVHLVRSQLKKYDLPSSWTTLRYELNRWHRIRTVLPKDRAQAILLKQDQDLTPLRKQIALILGLQTHRFATKKMIDRDTKV